MQATRISVVDPEYRANYRADFETWSENNTEAFAGLHNQGKLILIIFDEASAISRQIWEVTKGALTDENTIILWLVFGNPTINDGPFRECFGAQKHRWRTRQLDSRTVDGTNKIEIGKWVEDFGEDSDFVRVRVRGEFPRQGNTQFIRPVVRLQDDDFPALLLDGPDVFVPQDGMELYLRGKLAFDKIEVIPAEDVHHGLPCGRHTLDHDTWRRGRFPALLSVRGGNESQNE